MASFRSRPGGSVRLQLEGAEAHILHQVTSELGSLIEGEVADDPVELRLFPSAYESPTDEANYRDLIGEDLRREKLEALERVASAVEARAATEIELGPEDVDAWLASLTDLRLAIGTRLEVDEERMSGEVDPGDPDAETLTVLHWLGWLQEGILRSLESSEPGADT